jgi:hypothetical protein
MLQAAPAIADPTYGVMNAAGGIYWRSAPDWNTPEAAAGNGFYPDTIVSVHCYQAGAGNVPGSADYMWEQASVAAGSGHGSGWINEHFINDGQPINQPSPGVPPCGSAPALPPPTPAGGGLVFPVFNAEGGIYYRTGPHWSETRAEPGVGVYNGDQVELICGAYGDAVGPYNNTAWSYVRNLTRPAIGSGWVNEHFINDGAVAYQFVPGEPICGPEIPGAGSAGGGGSTGPVRSFPPGGSLYYSPYKSSDPGHGAEIILHYGFLNRSKKWIWAPAPSSFTANFDEWHPGPTNSCSSAGLTSPARAVGGIVGGKTVTTLAAWSAARTAPLLFLQAPPPWAGQINYILLFDPGNKDDYDSSDCAKKYPRLYSQLASWLGDRAGNKLVVLAGERTAQDHHAGIQTSMFPAVRSYRNPANRNIRKQVVVCNYEGMSHEEVWIKFRDEMNDSPITLGTCPTDPRNGKRPVSWNP